MHTSVEYCLKHPNLNTLVVFFSYNRFSGWNVGLVLDVCLCNSYFDETREWERLKLNLIYNKVVHYQTTNYL